ncbi:MAG: prealbumin-like fold domain-containing protein [Cyclobacteriaceae bacterium]|nr:prealbumin-like fold domain-containing protein [Cyclobacteriaceae bacterium]
MRIILPALLCVFLVGTAMKAEDQLIKTALRVTVLDDSGNITEGAEVQLYKSEEDYKKEVNPVTDKLITNEKGQVYFKELEPRVYYILATKGDMNNWSGGVQTDKLKEKKVNKINIIIE